MADCARSIVHEPIVRPTEVHHMEKAADRVKIKETGYSNLKDNPCPKLNAVPVGGGL